MRVTLTLTEIDIRLARIEIEFVNLATARVSLDKMRVVVKLGGGVITEKSQLCTPNLAAISALASAVKELQDQGYAVILVHGAGSYGHMRAKQWRLTEGVLPKDTFRGLSTEDCQSQESAVKLVQRDMLALNHLVVDALNTLEVKAESYAPHEHFVGDDQHFKGSLDMFKRAARDPVPVTFGDVVPVDGEKQFGILSGDDLVVRLSKELEVDRLVFAVKGVDGKIFKGEGSIILIYKHKGILKRPPGSCGMNGEDALLETFSSMSEFGAAHNEAIDVTGGIAYKASRALMVAEAGVEVLLVNGDMTERVVAACKGHDVRGTRVVL